MGSDQTNSNLHPALSITAAPCPSTTLGAAPWRHALAEVHTHPHSSQDMGWGLGHWAEGLEGRCIGGAAVTLGHTAGSGRSVERPGDGGLRLLLTHIQRSCPHDSLLSHKQMLML